MSDDKLLPAPVQALVRAINDGDQDAFAAAFTEDGRVDDWRRILTGPDGVRDWLRTDAIERNGQMTVVAAEVEDDIVRLVFDWVSTGFNGRSDAIVIVRDDRVAEFRILPAEH